MNAEAAKVNTGNTLEAFPRFAAGAVRGVPCKFPEAEQEQARTLARVNARAGGIFGTEAEQLILTRQELRAGFRIWCSASPRRAVDNWRGHAYPVFNRLKRIPGVFRTSAAPALLKVKKCPAEGKNSGAAYLASISAGFLNRIRTSSPRWRGTQSHARRKIKTAYRARFTAAELAEQGRRIKEALRWKSQHKADVYRKIVGRIIPEHYASAYLELVRAAQNRPQALAQVFRVFLRTARMLAAYCPKYLRDMLAELRRFRAERDTYAGFVQHINAAEFMLFLAELSERFPDAERIPRPPDLLPLPPSAPLAPPA